MNNFRRVLSNFLVYLAHKIYPKNEKVYSFWAQLMVDKMIMGNAIVRIDPREIVDEKTK